MGVSVREKPKNSGYWWLFIRHQGQRVCQYVSQNKEIADDAAKDIEREIRTGRFDLEALKASRIAKEEEPPKPEIPTLKDYFARFEREHLNLTVSESTAKLYAYVFRLHLLPALIPDNPDLKDSPRRALGDFRLDELGRSHLKILVGSLLKKKCSRVVNESVKAADGSVTTKKKTIHFNLSKPSLRIILSALTTCLTNAQREDGLIPANPALSLGKFIKQQSLDTKASILSNPRKCQYFFRPCRKPRRAFSRCSLSCCIPEFAAVNVAACSGPTWILETDTC